LSSALKNFVSNFIALLVMNAPYDYYLQDVLFAVCEEELVVFIKVKCHLVEN